MQATTPSLPADAKRSPFEQPSDKVFAVLTLAGLEPAIFGSEDQRLIH